MAESLYHGTIDILLADILRDGLHSPSYWGSRRVAEYYARDGQDGRGYEPILIRKSWSAFDKTALGVDHNSVAEPLTYTLDVQEEELYEEFCAGNKSWQSSWEIYESVIYSRSIAVGETEVIYLNGPPKERRRPFFWRVVAKTQSGKPKMVEFEGGASLSRKGLIIAAERIVPCEQWGMTAKSSKEWGQEGLSQGEIEAAGEYWLSLQKS